MLFRTITNKKSSKINEEKTPTQKKLKTSTSVVLTSILIDIELSYRFVNSTIINMKLWIASAIKKGQKKKFKFIFQAIDRQRELKT